MPQDIETPDPDYIKGFNEGHLIAQHKPELAEKLAQALEESSSSRGQGFKDGRQEAAMELRREKYPAWRRTDWMDKPNETSVPDKTKEADKDLDGPEPDID